MTEDRPIALYSLAAALAWSLAVGLSFLWNYHLSRDEVIALAQNQAIANIEKDLAFRRWVTAHGGVYVPVDDVTPPNPFLRVPDRDIDGPGGRRLTLMNPAYALRQMQQMFNGGQGVSAHITSLRPLNPGNAPDAWETEALRAFERGERQVAAVSELQGKPTMRVIRALIVEPGCLKCHPTYSQGDVRGGLSASVDLAPFLANFAEDARGLSISHGGAWIIGLMVVGQSPRLLASGRHDRLFYQDMWSSIGDNGYWRGEIWNRRKNGDIYPGLLTISAVTGAGGQVSHYVGTFADISQIKAQQARLELLAHFDPLTRVPNRVLMADRLAQAVAQTRRNGTLLAVGFLDLDGFKAINDSLGHSVGDQLLIQIADRLKNCIRGGDTVARLGGDEFVLVLCGLEDLQECDRAINRILTEVALPYLINGQSRWLSASLGVTLFPHDGSDPDTLLRHADHAMYAAKQAGGNRYHMFDPVQDRQVHDHHEAFARIRAALENEELCLYFQPKINMREGVVAGAEALIRWQHPERGLLPPADFLPLIDESELAAPLGEWVIRTALRQMDIWRAAGLRLPVSVNIAARHLQAGDFAQRIRDILAEFPDDLAACLEFEVLETAALENISGVAQVIVECDKMGIDFALDDFGTGYSSLSYLKRLPAKTLKIDQSFVRTMLIDLEDLAIVEGVVSLTQAFRRKVIAEGVESAEHGLVLLQLGCDFGQGFGIARPMPAKDIPGWIGSWSPDPRWTQTNSLSLRRDEFPLLAMEIEHRNWVAAIAAALRGGTIEPPLDPQACRFGLWYLGDGQEKYGRLAEFAALRSSHDGIHRLAAELIDLARRGQTDEALARHDDLFAASEEFLGKFNRMKETIVAGHRLQTAEVN